MNTQTFNLSLPKELVRAVDKQAKKEFSSSSDYVCKAVLNQANKKGKALGFRSEQQLYDYINRSAR
jgi:metal-responsive CopG/Arc/MetJ family transcriptional regulator